MGFPSTGKQLYLGEGDFSFTRSLCEKDHLPKGAIVTCYSKDLTDEASDNSAYLQSTGITVLTGVDATKLASYEAISGNRYDYIIFNFPHTGHKMKIHLCRALLRDFLASAAPLLADSGQVWVTLCAGQGGTAGDSVRRAWSDSWQLTAQAAAAGLVLRRLEPFQAQQVPGYRPTGNRGSQSRTFHTRDGLIHVLEAGRPLCPDTVRRRLPGGPARLLLDGTPLPLAQYWLRRLPPDDSSLAAHVVRRLAAGATPRPRVLVEHDGRCYGAGPAELSDAAAGGDLVCRSDGGGSPEEGSGAGQDVRVTYTVRDGEVGPTVADAPLRTRLTISGPADAAPEPRHALAAFGLVCKKSRQEDGLELRAGCGSGWLPVARVRTGDTDSSTVTFDVDAITACWVQEDDWRHAVRSDFTADGTALRLHSVYPPSYSLDMSFWVSGGGPSDAPFSWCRLRRALRAALGELLVRLELIDEYEQPDSGRRACTVRLEYQDLSGPLSHGGVRHLHEQVLPEVLRDALGVDTR